MIKQYIFKVIPQDKNERINFNMGSIMHGRMIESLPEQIAQQLHNTSARPYSQAIYVKDDIGYWQINALTLEMNNYLEQLAKQWNDNVIYLRQRDKKYHIQLHNISNGYSYQDFSRCFFTIAQPQRYLHIKFITPTSFKSNGEYQMFPNINLILASLCRRWNALSDSIVFEDEAAYKDICKSTFIHGYHLSSRRFGLEKIKITGFSGDIDIFIKGPEMTVRWLNMLFAYGQFCGIGIKTALGMGNVKVWAKNREDNNTSVTALIK
ncbi:CRISPR system precrRNA processing endoribonuclease RAMP protein Cas6 [Pectinatus brassicae]|uniref:CRISPR-associated endoribonuclease Cas6 n=1 Tax=Pectinatus brassicae TaxID=862415 RepID=A0A840UCP0_9FIRM|nr:CRISPR system precrRNA processing endoribonuclease RAMP protein Cas6 [Pectinatus brassicae]MBB5335491.1 CRISPR-associated endoribonuclease Cas6 [Pectinatus brassicae]